MFIGYIIVQQLCGYNVWYIQAIYRDIIIIIIIICYHHFARYTQLYT